MNDNPYSPLTKKEAGFIIARVRQVWRWYSEKRKECLKAKVCVKCGKERELQADHIEPVVNPKKGWEGWDVYVRNMFEGKLQAVCKPCHKEKSSKENKERRERSKKLSQT